MNEKPWPDDKPLGIYIEPHQTERDSTTSWWLEPDFYAKAKQRAPKLRATRFGQQSVFTTGKDSDR